MTGMSGPSSSSRSGGAGGGGGGGGRHRSFGLGAPVGETNNQQQRGGFSTLVQMAAVERFAAPVPDEEEEEEVQPQRRLRSQQSQGPTALTSIYAAAPPPPPQRGPTAYGNPLARGARAPSPAEAAQTVRRTPDPVGAAHGIGRAQQQQRKVQQITTGPPGHGKRADLDLQHPFDEAPRQQQQQEEEEEEGKRATGRDKARQAQAQQPIGEWLGRGGAGGVKKKGGGLNALNLQPRSGGSSDPGARGRLAHKRLTDTSKRRDSGDGVRYGGSSDEDLPEPEDERVARRKGGSSGGKGKAPAGAARGKKKEPKVPEVIEIGSSDEDENVQVQPLSSSEDGESGEFRATTISSRRGKEGAAFGPLHVHAELAFIGTYPKGWLEGGGGGSSSNGDGGRRASPRKARAKKDDGGDDEDDWGKDAEEAAAKERGDGEEGQGEEVEATQTQEGVTWEEIPCFNTQAIFELDNKLLRVEWTHTEIADPSYFGDRHLPFAGLEAVHLFERLDELDGRSLLVLAGAPMSKKRIKRDGEKEAPRLVVAMVIDPEARVPPVSADGSRSKNAQMLNQLFGPKGRGSKSEELKHVRRRLDNPAEFVERHELAAALAQRVAALSAFALGDQRGEGAEKKLYRLHRDQYLALKAQQEGNLRRSSRTSTRASTAAAAAGVGRVGGGVVSLAGEGEARLLFKFPLEEEEMDRVTVTTLDRERLEPGEFLNDNVIDFHFKYYMSKVKQNNPERHQALLEGVHIFSTHFFSKLTEEVFIPPVEELVAAAEAKAKAKAAAAAKKEEGWGGGGRKKKGEEEGKSEAARSEEGGDGEDDEEDDISLLKTADARGKGKDKGKGKEAEDGEGAAAASSSSVASASPVPRRLSQTETRRLKEEARAKAQHALVARWTKSIDLFGKKMVLVPINEALHWSLAVLCNLDQIQHLTEPAHKPPKSPKPSPAPSRRSLRRSQGGAGSPVSSSAVQSVASSQQVPSEQEQEEGSVSASASASAASALEKEDGGKQQEQEQEQEEREATHCRGSRTDRGAAAKPSKDDDAASSVAPMSVDGEDDDDDEEEEGGGGGNGEEDGAVMGVGGRPCLVFMDSLHAHRADRIHMALVKYLQNEWKKRKPDLPLPCITKETIAIVKPQVPTQDNSCDCGVFVLKYGELMLGDVLDTLPRWTAQDLTRQERLRRFIPADCFDLPAVAAKRRELMGVFSHLEHVYEGQQNAAEDEANAEAAQAAAAAAAGGDQNGPSQEQEQEASESASSSSFSSSSDAAAAAAAASPSAPSEEMEGAAAGGAGEGTAEGRGDGRQQKKRRAEAPREREQDEEQDEEATQPEALAPPRRSSPAAAATAAAASPSPSPSAKASRRKGRREEEEEAQQAQQQVATGGDLFDDLFPSEMDFPPAADVANGGGKKRKAVAAAADGNGDGPSPEAASQEVGDVAPPDVVNVDDDEEEEEEEGRRSKLSSADVSEDDATSVDARNHAVATGSAGKEMLLKPLEDVALDTFGGGGAEAKGKGGGKGRKRARAEEKARGGGSKSPIPVDDD